MVLKVGKAAQLIAALDAAAADIEVGAKPPMVVVDSLAGAISDLSVEHSAKYDAGPKTLDVLLSKTPADEGASFMVGMDFAKAESDLTAAFAYGMSLGKTSPEMLIPSTPSAHPSLFGELSQSETDKAAKFIDLSIGADMALKIAGQPATPAFVVGASVPNKEVVTQVTDPLPSMLGKMPKVQASEEEVIEAQLIAKHAVVVGQSEQDQLVTELLDLERRLIEMEVPEMLKQKDELRKKILALNSSADAEKPLVITVEGQGVIEFSACSREFKLGEKGKLASALGEETFFELAKFSVTDLKKVLSENELDTMGSYVTTNSRTLKIKPKAK